MPQPPNPCQEKYVPGPGLWAWKPVSLRFGYSRKEIEERLSCFSVIAPEDRERLKKNLRRLMKGMRLGPGEYRVMHKDGEAFPAMIHSKAIKDADGRPLGLRGVMMDISALKQAEHRVTAYQDKLKSLASELSLAEERIRRKTAAELHDTIGQSVAFARMKLTALQKGVEEASISTGLAEVIELLDGAMVHTRSLIFELSTPVLYEFGLGSAVNDLAKKMKERHGLRVSCRDDGKEKPLSEDVKVLLYQAVKELLHNVLKHAGVRAVEVKTQRAGDHIKLEVSDQGVGFAASGGDPALDNAGSFGLFNIRERVESIGGRFKIASKPGKGTRVTLTAPLSSQENA